MPKAIGIFLCFVGLWAGTQWSSEQSISLKRNEVYKVNLIFGANEVREFQMHWTLFVDGALVFLAKYDHFNHQTLLRKQYQNNSMRITLGRESRIGSSPAYLVVIFQDYDFKKESVTFKILIYGDVFIQEGDKGET